MRTFDTKWYNIHMKAREISYPDEATKSLPIGDFNLHFERLCSDGDHPEAVTELYAPFTEEDFRSALLDPSLPARYKTVESSRQRIEALERSKSVGAYLVSLEDEIANLQVIGTVVAGVPQDPEKFSNRIVRKIRSSKQQTRHLSSWFDSERTRMYQLEDSVVASAMLAGGIAVCRAAGVDIIQTVVPFESGNQSRLVVPENMLELPSYGFESGGEDSVTVEDKEYPGIKYVMQLSS